MKTEDALITRIVDITVHIQECYPELYCNLNEMYATLPIIETPVISIKSLQMWFESLRMLVTRYEAAQLQ